MRRTTITFLGTLLLAGALMAVPVMADEAAAANVPDTLAADRESLIADVSGLFEQLEYEDEQTGLSITYNLYLPESYDEDQVYPMVVFIADSSCVGSNPLASLNQGRGALVWASEEWQQAYPTIVAVPTFPVTILDDHSGYTTTDYVELTGRFIESMEENYAVDPARVYGTGQSMGCMTTLILASEYPDLYRACMFVDGQWDVSTLSGLEQETFVYFAAEDDSNAWNGVQEVMALFDADDVDYIYAQWDGTWSEAELTEAAKTLFSDAHERYFISWASGTIEPKNGNAGNSAGGQSEGEAADGESAPSQGEQENGESPAGESEGNEAGESDGAEGGANSSMYHMASFDYAYNCIAVMEWLMGQN